MWRFLSFVLLIASCVAPLLGQANPEEQLNVRVTYEDDRKAGANVRVELVSAYGSSVETRTTDGFGSVIFARLRPAKYKLRISGIGVVTTETGEIDLSDSGPNITQFVSVKRVASDQIGSGTLSVADLSIPPDAKKEFSKGADSMEKKKWTEAKDHFSRSISIYSKYALAYNNLGVTYLKLGQGAAAVESFQNALRYDENIGQANLYLGQFYYDNKDYRQAEPCLQRAAVAEPLNAQILLALANSQLQNGETDQALANAKRVHSLPDHHKFAIAHLIAADVLSKRGDTQKVAEEYRQFLQEDPSSPLAPRVKDALTKLIPDS
jgi:tetratricopeptide (TPR) repeat protein